MRTTAVLKSASRTPLIKFLGKRTTPSKTSFTQFCLSYMLNVLFPLQHQLTTPLMSILHLPLSRCPTPSPRTDPRPSSMVL